MIKILYKSYSEKIYYSIKSRHKFIRQLIENYGKTCDKNYHLFMCTHWTKFFYFISCKYARFCGSRTSIFSHRVQWLELHSLYLLMKSVQKT